MNNKPKFQPHEVCRYCEKQYKDHHGDGDAPCRGMKELFLAIIEDTHMTPDIKKIIREFSDEIWNQNGKHTHADLDEQIVDFTHYLLTAAFEAVRVEDWVPIKALSRDVRCEGYNAANAERRRKEEEVLEAIK